MGQYHLIANMDRKEYLTARAFGEGVKLMEFAPGSNGVMTGLAALLAEQNGRGMGDLHPWTDAEIYGEDRAVPETGSEDYLMDQVIGRWAGDRVAIIGDYWKADDPVAGPANGGPWGEDAEEWTDVSPVVLAAIEMDYYIRSERGVTGKSEMLRPDMIL